MVNESIPNFEVEAIPDDDFLFMRVHENDFRNEKPVPGAFRNQPKGAVGMSVDWSKHCSPNDTRSRGSQPSHKYTIIKFTAGAARRIPNQTVEHKPVNPPDLPNQAHAEVVGEKTTAAREQYMRIWELEITLGEN